MHTIKTMNALTWEQQATLEAELLAICKVNQGEYRLADHPKHSWSTTYGDEFIDAAASLHNLYRARGSSNVEFYMSHAFLEAGVKSCRGAAMTLDKVRYLLDSHVRRLALGQK